MDHQRLAEMLGSCSWHVGPRLGRPEREQCLSADHGVERLVGQRNHLLSEAERPFVLVVAPA